MIERLRVTVGGGNIYRLTTGMVVDPGFAQIRIGFLGQPLADAVIVPGPWIVVDIDIPSGIVTVERGHVRPSWWRRLWRRMRGRA